MSNLQLAKDIYAAFARGDIAAVLARFDSAIECREAEGNPYQPDGAVWVGPQAVLEKLFMSLGSDWDGFAVTVGRLHDAGEHVVMEGRYTARTRPLAGASTLRCVTSCGFRDDKLSSFQHYLDTAQMQNVMATR